MDAVAPLTVRPDTCTDLPVPTFLSPNAPAADPVFRVTVSPFCTPESDADPVLRVAVVDAS